MGAFYNDAMVGAMAFNNQRNTQKVELIRFCSDGKVRAGMFSRMFKNACDEYNLNRVISYADLRYSQGLVYANNGFDLVDEIPPDYRYIDGRRTWHKSSFTKSRIAKKFGIDMTTMTEKQAMEQLNIPRIYDCGKLKFEWTRKT